MFFALVQRSALGALIAGVAACGVSCSSTGNATAHGGDGGTDTIPSNVVSFDAPSPLLVKPGDSVDVGITVTGPDALVSVWLEGDYADASLGSGDVSTQGGHARVTLHAPQVAATFAMRARVTGSPDAQLAVSVSASGFGAVRVIPQYSGHRPTPDVTASVFVGTTCADLGKTALKDGLPVSNGDLATPLALAGIPAGGRVAVVARVRYYAGGCADVDALVRDTSRDVVVPVFDRPMALDRTDLETLFTFQPDTTDAAAWSSMLDAAIAEAARALMPSGSSEATRVLDAMHDAAPSASQGAFDSARSSGAWDARAATWLGQHPPSIHDRALAWLSAGKPDDLGDLVAHLGAGTSAGYGTLTLTTFGKFDAGSAGLRVRAPFGWIADATDTVHLSGTVHLFPTALVARSADSQAAATVSGATNVSTALATQLDCGGLATALVGSGVSYPSCNAACTASLCKTALGALWDAASSTSSTANEDVPVGITASAPARVGDNAEPIQFAGAWVGTVGANGTTTFATKGMAKGLHGSVPR